MGLLVLILSTFQAVAHAYDFPIPSTVSLLEAKVIYVAPEARRSQGDNFHEIYKKKAVVQSGLHRFHRGQLVYKCRPQQELCEFVEFVFQRTYEKCILTKGTVRCSGRLYPAPEYSEASENARWMDRELSPEEDFSGRHWYDAERRGYNDGAEDGIADRDPHL